MDLVVDNPFRILGLDATATPREISKRTSDLETFAELGKIKNYETDLSFMGAVQRDAEAVKGAAQKIEQAGSKLFHSFFWFRSGHEGDAAALEALSSGQLSVALAAWDEELAKTGKKRYSSRLNRAVLQLWLATRGTFDKERFSKALEDIGFVIDDHLEQSVDDVLGSSAAGMNQEALWKRIVDALVAAVLSAQSMPFGANALGMLGASWSFPEKAFDYLTTRLSNPVFDRLHNIVEESHALCARAKGVSELRALSSFEKAELLLEELQSNLGEDHPRFQSTASSVAEELCNLAILAYNKFDDLELAGQLIAWATRLPSFGQAKARIVENKATLEKNMDHQRAETLLAPITALLDKPLTSLNAAENKIDAIKKQLAALEQKLGARENETYVEASTRSAVHVFNYLIDAGNDAQKSASNRAALIQAHETVARTLSFAHQLQKFKVTNECAVWLQKNVTVMANVHTQMGAAIERSKPSFWSQVPGFVWWIVIAFVFFFFKSM